MQNQTLALIKLEISIKKKKKFSLVFISYLLYSVQGPNVI